MTGSLIGVEKLLLQSNRCLSSLRSNMSLGAIEI